MLLAMEFGDVIVKINKVANEKKISDDEVTFHGVIGQQSVYYPINKKTVWTNGIDSYVKI